MFGPAACPECDARNRSIGKVDGGCRPGCPNNWGQRSQGEMIAEALDVPLVTVPPGGGAVREEQRELDLPGRAPWAPEGGYEGYSRTPDGRYGME